MSMGVQVPLYVKNKICKFYRSEKKIFLYNKENFL